MKKIVAIAVLVLAGTFANAQETLAVKSSQVHDAAKTGKLVLNVPESVTEQQVNDLKGYYTRYYSVNFDEDKDQLTFNLVSNDKLSFHVINRMLVGLGFKKVVVDGAVMNFDEMVEKYYN